MSDIYSKAMYLEGIPCEQWKDYIGAGYRSCTYGSDHERNGQITLLGFDKAGNPKTFIAPWQSHIKYNVKFKTGETDIFDRHIATKMFRNAYERSQYVKSASGISIVECLKPEQEFLHFLFDDDVLDDSFNKQKLRIQYIDIETEISDQFMKPSVADNRINMITVYDNVTEKFHTWSLEHAEVDFKEEPLNTMDKSKFDFREFHDNEVRMLEDFCDWLDDNPGDVSFGWNIKGYDWPYIVTRISKVLGKEWLTKLSPVNRPPYIKDVNHDNSRADVAAEIEVDIPGLFIADGLVLYRDKFLFSPALDGGYSLNNVGEHEGLGKKVEYEGSLKDLYVKNYQKFYEYNVRDVDLAKRIDDKRKMIALARQVSSFGLTNYGAIYSSIGYLIGSVLSFAKTQMGGKVFTSYLQEKHQFNSFEGAYVFDTIPGLYKGGVGCIDFASLYPSNIRSINASPETYIGKIVIHRKDKSGATICNTENDIRFNPFSDEDSVDDGPDSPSTVLNAGDSSILKLELKLPGPKDIRKTVTLEQLRALIREKCIWTTNNTLFLKHEVKWGVIAKWCEYFYGLRKTAKKKMLKLVHLMHNEEEVAKMTKQQKIENTINIENLDSIQHALKIMINSIYGAMGTAFSPIADPNIAQSVTRQGRFANQSTSRFIKKYFIDNYNARSDYQVVCGGDTDSCARETLVRIKR